jgi:hypothetical protein
MTDKILDDGTPLTDETVDKLVADAYEALAGGKYHLITNPHKTSAPIKPSAQNRAALLAQFPQK